MSDRLWDQPRGNESEEQVALALRDRGFTVFRGGWPDYLVIDESVGRGFMLELKSRTDRLRPDQKTMHRAVVNLGIRVHTIYYDEIEEFLDGDQAERLAPAPGRIAADYWSGVLDARRQEKSDLEAEIAQLQAELRKLRRRVNSAEWVTPSDMLNAHDVAELLGVSSHTVLDWWQAGKLPGFRLGGDHGPVRFQRSEVLAWLQSRRSPRSAADAPLEMSPATGSSRESRQTGTAKADPRTETP